MTKQRWLVAAAVIVIVGGVAFALTRDRDKSQDTSTPQGALLHQIDLLKKGQYGRAYDEIVPQQQALFTRDAYIACLSQEHPSVGDVKVQEVYTEQVAIPGTDDKLDSTAITVQISGTGLLGASTQTETFHEFNINGQWRFSISDPGSPQRGCN